MHILVFPGWYPSKVDKLTGDFIQRHMVAVSQYCRVSVVFPVKDSSINKKKTLTIKKGNLTEIYCYYPSLSSIRWLDNFLSFLRYNFYCLQAAKALNKDEKITVGHLYVLQKNHLIGVLLKLLYNITYVVSEQSTLYVDGRFEKMNQIGRAIFRWTFKNSRSFHAVSNHLMKALKDKLRLNKEGVVISNVVDSTLFYYDHQVVNDRVTFVHVSNMVYQKNVEGMLEAFLKLSMSILLMPFVKDLLFRFLVKLRSQR